MARKSPSVGISVTSPVSVSRSTTPVNTASPRTSMTSEFQRTAIFGWARARSCMIRLPRNWSRRWTITTSVAKRVRNVASLSAVSPPPTTATFLPRKKKPSHVAQGV
jgi:hypothetical protein